MWFSYIKVSVMYLLILLKCFDNQIFQNIFEAKPIMIISFLQNFFTLISPLVWELTLLQKTPLYSKNGKSVKHTKNGPLAKFILCFKMYYWVLSSLKNGLFCLQQMFEKYLWNASLWFILRSSLYVLHIFVTEFWMIQKCFVCEGYYWPNDLMWSLALKFSVVFLQLTSHVTHMFTCS